MHKQFLSTSIETLFYIHYEEVYGTTVISRLEMLDLSRIALYNRSFVMFATCTDFLSDFRHYVLLQMMQPTAHQKIDHRLALITYV